MNTLATSQNRFGFKLLQTLHAAQPGKNLFISPYSIASALSMTMSGTTGATRAAMSQTLGTAAFAPDALDKAYWDERTVWEKKTPGELVARAAILRVANSLWADRRFTINSEYRTRVARYYGGQATVLDMHSPQAASSINSWVSEHTQNKIKQIVTPSTLQNSLLVLVNAVYFRGRWVSEFAPNVTKPGKFTCANGIPKQVALMRQESEHIGYRREKTFTVVYLPYESYPGPQTAMYVLLPDNPNGLPALLRQLDAAKWERLRGGFATNTIVDLTLPRFRLDYAASLKKPLEQMGMKPAFAVSGDFAPMGLSPGFVGDVLHKTFLAVDEKGTEAAAATAAIAAGGAAAPFTPPQRVTVRVDRPFFCAIVEEDTGAILFAGAIYDPGSNTGL